MPDLTTLCAAQAHHPCSLLSASYYRLSCNQGHGAEPDRAVRKHEGAFASAVVAVPDTAKV